MLERFKGVTATKEQWENSTKVIPDEVWAVVIIEGTEGQPSLLGIKIGTGNTFSNTPYLFDPTVLQNKIDKPTASEPSNIKFLAETGEYRTIDLSQLEVNIDSVLSDLDSKELKITTKEQVAWIESQMFSSPKINSLSSTSSFIGPVEMGTTIQGDFNLKWAISDQENVQSINLSVSEGVWNGVGEINSPKSTRSKVLSTSSPISFNKIKKIDLTLTGEDVKGNSIGKRTISMIYTHRIFYGTISDRNVSDFSDIQGLKSILSNNRSHTLNFTPNGSRYSIILIPQEIDQNGINIVNVNAPSIDHSYNMNEGEGGTIAKYTLTRNSIIYNAYVTFGPTSGVSSAIIK